MDNIRWWWSHVIFCVLGILLVMPHLQAEVGLMIATPSLLVIPWMVRRIATWRKDRQDMKDFQRQIRELIDG